MDDKVKVSVLLSADVHRRLKIAAYEQQITIQKAMEDAARVLVDDRASLLSIPTLAPREIRVLQTKLQRVIESGDKSAMLNSVAALEALSKLIDTQARRVRGYLEPSEGAGPPAGIVAREATKRFRANALNPRPDHGTLDEGILQGPFSFRLDSVSEEFDTLINELCANPRDIHKLTHRRFEELVSEIWRRMGYAVELTPQTRDGGRDVIATRFAETRSQVLIECKKYAPNNAVGLDAVQRLLGAVYQYNATQGVLTTTSALTRDALRVVDSKPHQLAAHEYRDVVSLLWRVRMIVVPTPDLWLPTKGRG